MTINTQPTNITIVTIPGDRVLVSDSKFKIPKNIEITCLLFPDGQIFQIGRPIGTFETLWQYINEKKVVDVT